MTLSEKTKQILQDKQTNLLPSNLKKGVSCLGVDGELDTTITEEQYLEALATVNEILGIEEE